MLWIVCYPSDADNACLFDKVPIFRTPDDTGKLTLLLNEFTTIFLFTDFVKPSIGEKTADQSHSVCPGMQGVTASASSGEVCLHAFTHSCQVI